MFKMYEGKGEDTALVVQINGLEGEQADTRVTIVSTESHDEEREAE